MRCAAMNTGPKVKFMIAEMNNARRNLEMNCTTCGQVSLHSEISSPCEAALSTPPENTANISTISIPRIPQTSIFGNTPLTLTHFLCTSRAARNSPIMERMANFTNPMI